MKTKMVALSATIASLYIALVVGLAPISFLQIQFRIANALLGLVPLAGLPAVFGITVGVLIGNLSSPLGPLDLLSSAPTLLGCLIIYWLRKVSVVAGLAIYTIILSVCVSFLLQYLLNLPYLPTFIYLLIGIGAVTVGLGYILYRALLKVGFEKLLSL